jgi:hypothetical protein
MESLKEITQGSMKGKNILDGTSVSWTKSLVIPSKGFYIIEISR